jgi:HEAT repeat protein
MIKERAQSDENEDVRQSAVRELARGWRDEPDTLAIIKERAQSDENKNVRQSAVRELARGWKDEPEIQVFLESL